MFLLVINIYIFRWSQVLATWQMQEEEVLDFQD